MSRRLRNTIPNIANDKCNFFVLERSEITMSQFRTHYRQIMYVNRKRPTQKWATAILCLSSVVRTKSVNCTPESTNNFLYWSEIDVQYSSSGLLNLAAACCIFVPCSSVPVANVTEHFGSINLSNRWIVSAITAEYKWPMCGAEKKYSLFINTKTLFKIMKISTGTAKK